MSQSVAVAHKSWWYVVCATVSVAASVAASVSFLSKKAIFPRARKWKRLEFQWICTRMPAERSHRLGEQQRRTEWWVRNNKDTANDHLVQTCLYYAKHAIYKHATCKRVTTSIMQTCNNFHYANTRQLSLRRHNSQKGRQQKFRYKTCFKPENSLKTLFQYSTAACHSS